MTKSGNESVSPQIGIIIPAYNPNIPALVELIWRIRRSCGQMACAILIVDDGSVPAIELPEDLPLSVKLERHPGNQGKGAALKSGFRHFQKMNSISAVMTLDADLQHVPECIPQFVERYRTKGDQLIVGYRKRSPRIMPPHRLLSNTLTSLFISLITGQLIRDSQCGYRLISTKVLRSIPLKENGFHLESELLIRAGWGGVKMGFVPIPTIYGDEKSSIKNVTDTLNFLRLLIKLFWERKSG